MLKTLLNSRWVKLIFSIGLFYLAFRKVEIGKIVQELVKIPIWFVVVMVIYGIVMTAFGSYRWAIVLFNKVRIKDVLILTRAVFVASFYGLFLPSSVGVDLVRWLPLIKAYPELSKTRLVASVLIDRVVGFSCFILVAFGAALVGRELKINYPVYLLYLFGGLFLAVVIFYLVVYSGVLVNRLNWLKRFRWLNKLVEVMELLRSISIKKLGWCLAVGIISEFAWIMPIWWWGLITGAGISLISVMVIGPIVGLLLVLPISVAGFGARENLYLYFWGAMGIPAEKILLVSTMGGIMGILNALLGGLLLLK